MSHIVVLGAGLGGLLMAYEMKARMRRDERLTVVNLGGTRFVSPISATTALPSSRSPRFPRATSTGRRRATGSTLQSVGFEKYFLRKIRQGKAETFYENLVLDMLGIKKLKDIHMETAD